MEAALKIQTFYRSHLTRRKALSTISNISAQFDKIKSTFHPHCRIDYTAGNNTISTINVSHPFDQFDIPSSDPPACLPKLAYTSTNTPIHAYTESLNRLLSTLDGIESGGDRVVREKRKQMVLAVEREAQRMERWILAVWESALNSSLPEHLSSSQLTDVASDVELPSEIPSGEDHHGSVTTASSA